MLRRLGRTREGVVPTSVLWFALVHSYPLCRLVLRKSTLCLPFLFQTIYHPFPPRARFLSLSTPHTSPALYTGNDARNQRHAGQGSG